MTSRKKVALISIVDISKKNGQGIYALKTIESLCKSNEVEFHIIIPHPSDTEFSYPIKGFESIKYLPEKKKNRQVVWHFFTQLRLLFALIKLGKVDALVYSLKPTMIAPLIYSAINRCPIYLLVEGLGAETLKTITRGLGSILGLKVLEANIKNARRVFPAYISAKSWVDGLRNDNSLIIPCGVDGEVFQPKTKNTTKVLTLGYVGSFQERHMLGELIKSVKDINIKVFLVGDGNGRPELEKLSLQSGVADKVLFLGSKKQEELPDFFADCDLMWSACDERHWAVLIKGFEYLACNKKIIYVAKEDLSFVESNDFGFGLKNSQLESVRSLLTEIEQKYRDGLLFDNKTSREYILTNNSWDTFRIEALKDILQGNCKPPQIRRL